MLLPGVFFLYSGAFHSCILIIVVWTSLYYRFLPQGNSDTNADFRLLESQDGTVTFESVPCKGFYVGIQNKKVLQANLNIFLVVSLSRV